MMLINSLKNLVSTYSVYVHLCSAEAEVQKKGDLFHLLEMEKFSIGNIVL